MSAGSGSVAGGARKLRVLTFTTLFPNPAEPTRGIFVRSRLAALADAVDLTVVAPVNAGRNPGVLAMPTRRRDPAGFEVLHPRFAVLPGVLKGWDASLLYRETAAQVRFHSLAGGAPDLVDTHYAYPDGAAGAMLARALGVPYVVTVRGSDLEVLARGSRRAAIERTLREACAVVAVSRSLERRAIELGADPGRVHVIPNGVDTGRFRPGDRAMARRALGLPEEGPLLLAVARLDPVKGLGFLLEAFAALRGRDGTSGATLQIVGEGPERRTLEAAIERLGLSGAAVLRGAEPPERLPLWYAAADLVCLTSLSEGCPNVVTEALACGRPVVATPVGGVPELVRDGQNGWLIPERTPERAAEILSQALATPWAQDVIATRGRRSWEQVAGEQLAVYHAALSPAAMPAAIAESRLEGAR